MTTIKTDRKGFPFANLRDRFRKPEQRLFQAVRQGNFEIFKAFIESNSFSASMRVKPLWTREQTSNFRSERRKNSDYAYTENKNHPYMAGEDSGQSLLHYVITHAPSAQQSEMMMYLLSKGADPNVKTFFHETPLHYAAYNNQIEALAILVAHGGDLNAHASSRSNYVEDNPYWPTPIQMLDDDLRQEYEHESEAKLKAIFSAKYLQSQTPETLRSRAPMRL